MKMPIVVVGSPRSGTSPFAKYLVDNGLTTVEDSRTTIRYPAGYFEHAPALAFVAGIERLYGSRHAISEFPLFDETILKDEFFKSCFELAFEPLLSKRIEFLKHPALGLAIPFLIKSIPDVRIIALWRNPINAIPSIYLKEFGRFPGPGYLLRAYFIWCRYAKLIVEAKRTWPDRVFLLKADSLSSYQSTLQNILNDGAAVKIAVKSVNDSFSIKQLQRKWSIHWVMLYIISHVMATVTGMVIHGKYDSLRNASYWKQRLEDITEK